ncbi:MAG: class I mannose-6-phosphate isomerase [Phycisphaerales bacterium]|nr:class I mannose-6-phosphate isomerase [Phycisphaerales bacterium]
MTSCYPLLFQPILKQKVWGGRRLARFGKSLPPDESVRVGESWELADLATTSASGGGGEAAHSVIANGLLAGQTISDAARLWRHRLLGHNIYERQCARSNSETPPFPLLLKFLDAAEHLSVQVHPSPAYAAAHADAHLKTESWFVLDAEPMGGVEPLIFSGLRREIDERSLREMIASHRVQDALLSQPAVPGQCHTLPSGTVHALGAGVLVAEVQTPSDTTFRLYDWTKEYNRPRRELHLEQAMQCISFGDAPPPAPTWCSKTDSVARLADTGFYTIDELRFHAGEHRLEGARCYALMGVSGSGTVEAPDCEPVAISAGTTMLIPAGCADSTSIRGEAGLRVLRITLR